jgi:hypothetical protein
MLKDKDIELLNLKLQLLQNNDSNGTIILIIL